jgi:hypothetical protein
VLSAGRNKFIIINSQWKLEVLGDLGFSLRPQFNTSRLSTGVKNVERSRTLQLHDRELAYTVADLEDVRPSHHDEHDCSLSHHGCTRRRLWCHLVSMSAPSAIKESLSYSPESDAQKDLYTKGKQRDLLRPVGFQGRTEV